MLKGLFAGIVGIYFSIVGVFGGHPLVRPEPLNTETASTTESQTATNTNPLGNLPAPPKGQEGMTLTQVQQQLTKTSKVKATTTADTNSDQRPGNWCNGIHYMPCPSGYTYDVCPSDGSSLKCVITSSLTYCNSKYYKKCDDGNAPTCPASGNAICNSNSTGDQYSWVQGIIDSTKSAPSQTSNSSVNSYASSAAADCSQQQSKMEADIRAEIQAAGGFGTESQIVSMALSRMKAAGMTQCFAGSGVTGGSVSTHCNSLNGGLDCTSSNGTRTYVNPIPGSDSVDIRSYSY